MNRWSSDRLTGRTNHLRLVALEDLIDARLPLVARSAHGSRRLDRFSRDLEGGAEPWAPELLAHCHASILAQACNFGLTRMAQ
jgi:hypothetical protein